MRRRDFVSLMGGAAAWPLAAHAQQRTPMIGFISSRSPAESTAVVAAFRKGLGEAGFVEGQNVAIAFRWAEGRYERLPALAVELVGLRVDVIFAAGGPPSALAAKAATTTIPIVFSASNDPVRLGLVASLNRPGGNVTGMGTLVAELVTKSVAILKQLVPTAGVIGYLANPSNPSTKDAAEEAQASASKLGIEVPLLNASTVDELNSTFATASQQRIGAMVVHADPFFDSQREKIVALSAQHGIAGCYPWREYVQAGGLMSYGTNLPDLYRQAGAYAGRVLKGEKPADLPVMRPTKFELVLNTKTAKTLGVQIPQNLLAIADEVID